jgi:hypothetical protein
MFATTYAGKRGGYMIYRCTAGKGHLVRKLDLVDDVVERTMLARLERPDAARLFAPDVDLDALRARAVDRRTRRDAIAAMLADGLLSPDAARIQAQKLTGELATIKREIDSATGTGPLTPLASSNDIRATWSTLDLLARRAIVDTLCTVTILPQGKGQAFDSESVAIEWRTA